MLTNNLDVDYLRKWNRGCIQVYSLSIWDYGKAYLLSWLIGFYIYLINVFSLDYYGSFFFSCFFSYMVYWIPDIINFTFLHAGYFCFPICILKLFLGWRQVTYLLSLARMSQNNIYLRANYSPLTRKESSVYSNFLWLWTLPVGISTVPGHLFLLYTFPSNPIGVFFQISGRFLIHMFYSVLNWILKGTTLYTFNILPLSNFFLSGILFLDFYLLQLPCNLSNILTWVCFSLPRSLHLSFTMSWYSKLEQL